MRKTLGISLLFVEDVLLKNLTRILVTLSFVLMTGGAWADHNPGHAQSKVAQLEARVTALEALVVQLQADLSALETLTASMSVEPNNVVFTGVNVHIRSGAGSTNEGCGVPCDPSFPLSGLGNLIIGYNEDQVVPLVRTGSHNVIVGPEHSYSSFGGFVAGSGNTIGGVHATVTGGSGNAALSDHSAILGGLNNTTVNTRPPKEVPVGFAATISGGAENTATGDFASVSGGSNNVATANGASVSGGKTNVANSDLASISGGRNNTAGCDPLNLSVCANNASVSGGSNNAAFGEAASVSGGNARSASGDNDWVAGGLFQDF